jgi:ubiquinone/menaquinone biosynthesis C-methylase UbiE
MDLHKALLRSEKMPVDYKNIASYYDKVRISTPDYLRFWSMRITDYGSIDKNSRVLDIGCGTGRFTIMLSKISEAEIYTIEPSEDMLNEAVKKDKKKNICWNMAQAENLPFSNDIFDCVYMTFVFHQIKDKKKAVMEMNRVLKPKGKCVIMTTSTIHIRDSPLYLFPGLREIDLDRFPSLPELKEILRRGKFKEVHYHLDKYHTIKKPIEEYLKLIKGKHVSTLTLLTEDDFQKGYKIFEKKLRKKYKDYVELRHGNYIVSGEKSV